VYRLNKQHRYTHTPRTFSDVCVACVCVRVRVLDPLFDAIVMQLVASTSSPPRQKLLSTQTKLSQVYSSRKQAVSQLQARDKENTAALANLICIGAYMAKKAMDGHAPPLQLPVD
jgi:hypothetical protein